MLRSAGFPLYILERTVMKPEEKQLLLKDLCARLPYNVKVRGVFLRYNKDKDKILYVECDKELNWQDLKRYESLKPYLRPMSSMTSKEWVELCDCSVKDEASWVMTKNRQMFIPVQSREDYLNSKHFDYRGLIEKGLALEAPEGMYD